MLSTLKVCNLSTSTPFQHQTSILLDTVGSGNEDDEEDNEFFDCVADAATSNSTSPTTEHLTKSQHNKLSSTSSSNHHQSGSASGSKSKGGESPNKKGSDDQSNGTFIMKIPTHTGKKHRRNESEGSSSDTEEVDSKQVSRYHLLEIKTLLQSGLRSPGYDLL